MRKKVLLATTIATLLLLVIILFVAMTSSSEIRSPLLAFFLKIALCMPPIIGWIKSTEERESLALYTVLYGAMFICMVWLLFIKQLF
ncbi:MAG: hypothetical protein FWG28_05575 [Clostridiales bacterium]|nr:hypothetical protein [Clostridiales bacterium]